MTDRLKKTGACRLFCNFMITVAACGALSACSGGDNTPIDTLFVPCDGTAPSETDAGYIHGRVLAAETESPVSGAAVRLDGVDGCVSTDENGSFSFPLAGGGRFAMKITAAGRTHATRVSSVTAGHDISLGDVFLPLMDQAVSVIGPAGGTHRSATGGVELTFPAGALTAAREVRATRFNAGRELPGALPSTSHFTMAIEALAGDGKLDQPVIITIPNDYGFAPGTPVPVGVFNESTGEWEPDGMGTISDDGTQVVYEARHFSAFDCNYPVTSKGEPGMNGKDPRRPKDPCKRNGSSGNSVIDVRSGQLRLDFDMPLDVAGGGRRSVGLAYQSGAVSPWVWSGGLWADQSSDPATPEYAGVEVQVEGVFKKVFLKSAPEGNWAAFMWDGANGRNQMSRTGLYDGWIRVFNAEKGTFARADVFGGQPTGSLGIQADEPVEADTTIHTRFQFINGADSPVADGWYIKDIPELHVHQDGSVMVVTDGAPAGVFEPDRRAVIFAAGGSDSDCETGAPKENDCLEYPKDLAVGPDGSLYVNDDWTGRILKITKEGTYQEYFNGESDGYDFRSIAVAPDSTVYFADASSGKVFKIVDGKAEFVVGGDMPDLFGNTPTVTSATDLDFDSEGNLFIADWPQGLRVLSKDGVLSNAYDGANPDYPAPVAIDVVDDGSILLAEPMRMRVRRLMPDGRIVPVAGMDGVDGFSGDGGQGTKAKLNTPNGVAQGPDGTVYISDQFNHRIRAVDANGVIRTFAGKGNVTGSGFGDGGPATESLINAPSSPVFDGEGNLLVLGYGNGHVWKMEMAQRVYSRPSSTSDILAAAAEGSGWTLTRVDDTLTFDAAGLAVARKPVSGPDSTFQRDSDGRLTAIVWTDGARIDFSWGDNGLASISGPGGRTMQFSVNAGRDIELITFADGTSTQLEYDERGRMIGWTDAEGRSAQYVLDGYGRVSESKTPDGAVRRYSPMETAGLINDILSSAESDPESAAGLRPSNPADAVTQPVSTYTDASGRVITLKYDALGEATEAVLPGGATVTIQNHTCGMPSVVNIPDAGLWTYFYDEWGRTLVERTPAGNFEYEYDWENGGLLTGISTPGNHGFNMEYDENGNVSAIVVGGTSIFKFGYGDGGRIEWMENGAGQRSEWQWDEKDNVSGLVQSGIKVFEFGRDDSGTITSITDAVGGVTSFETDVMGRITAITDAAGGVHDIGMDKLGQVVSLTTTGPGVSDDAKTTWGRDGRGRVNSVSILGAGPWTIGYDAESRIESVTGPAGGVSTEYDEKGNVVTRRIAGGDGTVTSTATYEWDAAGHLISAVNETAEIKWEYDPETGLLKSVSQKISGMSEPVVLNYELDGDRYVRAVEYPALNGFDGGRYDYSYQAESGLLTEITDPASLYYDLYRDESGRIVEYEIDWGEPFEMTYEYSDRGHMGSIVAWVDSWRENTHMRFDYSADDDGAIVSETGTAGTTQYSYDAARRLISTVNTAAGIDESREFNARGEPIGPGFETDATGRLIRADGYTYEYDDAGRVVKRTADSDGAYVEFDWDGDDNLVAARSFASGGGAPEHVVSYGYDAIGRRVFREQDGEKVFFIHDFTDVVLEIEESGHVAAFYMHEPGQDRPLAMIRDGETYAFIVDAIGSVRGLVRLSDRTLVATRDYTGFGTVARSTGTIPFRYGFHSREQDPVTGLVHFRAREYDPISGRFVSTDPLKFTSFAGTYSFPGNNPVNLRDPQGTGPRAVKWAGEAVVGYNNGKTLVENAVNEKTSAVAGRDAGEVGVLVWKTAGSNTLDYFTKAASISPYQAMGPTVVDAAGYLYKGMKTKNPCDRAKLGGEILTDILPAGKTWFKPMVDSFNNFGNMMNAGK